MAESPIEKLDVGIALENWWKQQQFKKPDLIQIMPRTGGLGFPGQNFTKAGLELDAGNIVGLVELWGNLHDIYGTLDYTVIKKGASNAIRMKWGVQVTALAEFNEKLTEFLDDFIALASQE